MKKIKITTLMMVSALLLSCSAFEMKSPQSIEKKGEFQLEFLFEKDGCKIYRFYDSKWVYWSNCQGSTYEAHSERRGKVNVDVVNESITVKR